MRTLFAAAMLGVVMSGHASLTHARQGTETPPEGLAELREILATYRSARNAKPGYGGVSDAVTASSGWRVVSETTALRGTRRLTITRAENQQSFQASLVSTAKCGDAWFANEQGDIYVGKPLGCQ